MCLGIRAQAADITIARNAAPAPAKLESAVPPRAQQAKTRLARAERTARERLRQRRIVTYNLFHDPAFKLAGAVTDLRQLQAAPGLDAAAIGHGAPLAPAPRAASGARALKVEGTATDSAGIAFDCREKSPAPGTFRRVMTACYKARLDKSWKTQTYISKGFADDDPEWGGGLSFSYAH